MAVTILLKAVLPRPCKKTIFSVSHVRNLQSQEPDNHEQSAHGFAAVRAIFLPDVPLITKE
jgi:hypothetical protein